MSSEGKSKQRILMLFLIGVTLVSGLVAVQQFVEAFGVAREEHLERNPLTPGHVIYHIIITIVLAGISAISGAALYRLRRADSADVVEPALKEKILEKESAFGDSQRSFRAGDLSSAEYRAATNRLVAYPDDGVGSTARKLKNRMECELIDAAHGRRIVEPTEPTLDRRPPGSP